MCSMSRPRSDRVSLNRTKIGLKFDVNTVVVDEQPGLNRTKIGLKFCSAISTPLSSRGLNRTKIGLKCRHLGYTRLRSGV